MAGQPESATAPFYHGEWMMHSPTMDIIDYGCPYQRRPDPASGVGGAN